MLLCHSNIIASTVFYVTVTLFSKYHRDSILADMENDKTDKQLKPFRTGESRVEDSLNSTVTRESDKFMLRLPNGMRDLIAKEAKKNGRSMNAEIVSRLQDTFVVESEIEDFKASKSYRAKKFADSTTDFLMKHAKQEGVEFFQSIQLIAKVIKSLEKFDPNLHEGVNITFTQKDDEISSESNNNNIKPKANPNKKDR